MVDLKMPTSLVLSPRRERSYGHWSTSTNGFAPNCIVKIPVKKPLFRLSRFHLGVDGGVLGFCRSIQY